MAESIIRHQVANLGLTEVIANREKVRNAVKQEMQSIIQGWGMWLETVEITDIMVKSQSMFDDLQTEYRQTIRIAAEERRMDAQREISLAQTKRDTAVGSRRSEAEAARQKMNLRSKLTLQQERAKADEERHETLLSQLELERKLDMKGVSNEAEVEAAVAEKAVELEQRLADEELVMLKARLDLDRQIPDTTLKSEMIDATAKIYSDMPLQDVNLVSSSGKDAILPGLAKLLQEFKK
eukprot:NODE_1707_length_1087_cov_176.189788_g1392_i0.p1 GENE.NODE_1707_length_1087_cov_176.189788_g1392_i0~~NODE_1707_length_1087_cov_176.189788_g1392_i0.p1  ORF type:complete len:280 (-),score=95.51 NODE_1707_length_1087_cov_176.189788_g1392_i0:248-961(-)